MNLSVLEERDLISMGECRSAQRMCGYGHGKRDCHGRGVGQNLCGMVSERFFGRRRVQCFPKFGVGCHEFFSGNCDADTAGEFADDLFRARSSADRGLPC